MLSTNGACVHLDDIVSIRIPSSCFATENLQSPFNFQENWPTITTSSIKTMKDAMLTCRQTEHEFKEMDKKTPS